MQPALSASPGPDAEFNLSFNRASRVLMAPLFAGPRHSRLLVNEQNVFVTMGVGSWAFAALMPRSSITLVAPDFRPVRGWGAHGWNGRWLVNGSSQGIVRIDLDPPARASCLGIPVRLRQLRLSLEDPYGFMSAVKDGA